MFSHLTIGSNDIPRSRRFYDAIFQAAGGDPAVEDARGRLVYSHKGGRFIITRPLDGAPATAGNGLTVGLVIDSPEQADAWHAAGVANAGTTAESPPGVRRVPDGRVLYLAYLRDPDGNKLCAYHPMAG